MKLDKIYKILLIATMVGTLSGGVYAGVKSYIDKAIESKMIVASMETGMRITSMESDIKYIKENQSETNKLLREIIAGLSKR